MGLRFRKVFGRKPFRWTLTKRGVGVSWGFPGLRFGVSPSGDRYVSLGIPGTGIYWIKYFKSRKRSSGAHNIPNSKAQTIEWVDRE